MSMRSQKHTSQLLLWTSQQWRVGHLPVFGRTSSHPQPLLPLKGPQQARPWHTASLLPPSRYYLISTLPVLAFPLLLSHHVLRQPPLRLWTLCPHTLRCLFFHLASLLAPSFKILFTCYSHSSRPAQVGDTIVLEVKLAPRREA